MKERFGGNFIYKLVAVFLAVVLWFNASDQQSTVHEQRVTVPLEVRNLPASLVVTDLPANVQVHVEGRWGVVDNVDARDFSAFIGLESYKAGKHEAPVEVTVPPGVRLVKVSPSSITVELASVTSVQLPVVAEIRGEVAEGFRTLTPVIEPAEAVVSGPEVLLNKVRSARVQVNMNNVREDYVKVLPITLNTNNEGDYFNMTVNPGMAKVFIPVVREGQSKTVPVNVSVQGEPPKGYSIGRIQVQPQKVEIIGPQDALENIGSIRTHPIDVGERTTSFTENVGLEVPAAVEVSRQVGVDVFVEIIKE